METPDTRAETRATQDCRRCGACCFSESPRHARVTGDDHARLGDDAERFVVFQGDNRAYMRLDDLGGQRACAALSLDAHGAFSCSIYERRPQVCRDLERGSPACEGERLLKAPRVRLVTLRS